MCIRDSVYTTLVSVIFVIFENIDTTFPVVKIQNVVQYLHDTRVYFFIVKMCIRDRHQYTGNGYEDQYQGVFS